MNNGLFGCDVVRKNERVFVVVSFFAKIQAKK
jgi:hypothetical protein